MDVHALAHADFYSVDIFGQSPYLTVCILSSFVDRIRFCTMGVSKAEKDKEKEIKKKEKEAKKKEKEEHNQRKAARAAQRLGNDEIKLEKENSARVADTILNQSSTNAAEPKPNADTLLDQSSTAGSVASPLLQTPRSQRSTSPPSRRSPSPRLPSPSRSDIMLADAVSPMEPVVADDSQANVPQYTVAAADKEMVNTASSPNAVPKGVRNKLYGAIRRNMIAA